MPPLFQSKAMGESEFMASNSSVTVTDTGFWFCWGLKFRNIRNIHPQQEVAVTEIWDKDPGGSLIKSCCPCLFLLDLAPVWEFAASGVCSHLFLCLRRVLFVGFGLPVH